MADKDLWTTFTKTGNVVDYLNYKGVPSDSDQGKLGEDTVESDNNCNRNDTVRNTYR